jgi:hAT family C-terminal dimerisation region
MDELESYLALGPEFLPDGHNSLLLYWKNNSTKWPHLASMARDYLAAPASSAGSERSFSTGRDMLGLNRHSLLPETMEASIRLRSWFKAGIDIDQTVI